MDDQLATAATAETIDPTLLQGMPQPKFTLPRGYWSAGHPFVPLRHVRSAETIRLLRPGQCSTPIRKRRLRPRLLPFHPWARGLHYQRQENARSIWSVGGKKANLTLIQGSNNILHRYANLTSSMPLASSGIRCHCNYHHSHQPFTRATITASAAPNHAPRDSTLAEFQATETGITTRAFCAPQGSTNSELPRT